MRVQFQVMPYKEVMNINCIYSAVMLIWKICTRYPSPGAGKIGEEIVGISICFLFQESLNYRYKFDHLTEVVFVRFLHCEVILFSSFSIVFWDEVTMSTSHIKSMVCFISLKGVYLHKLFGILIQKIFVSLPHLFISLIIYFLQYGVNDIWFITWVIIQLCVICFVAEIVLTLSTGSPISWVPCPLA